MAHHTVSDVMTTEVITVAEDAPFKDLAQLMASWLAGIVTPSDLLKPYLRGDETIRTEIFDDIITGCLGINPGLVKIAVQDGTVTLGGIVESKSMIPLAVRMSRAVDGVIDVVDHLGYTTDDTRLPAPRTPPALNH